MTKYIVKNCPAYIYGSCQSVNVDFKINFECCIKNTDCPIKQVVEMCKHNLCDSSACILAGTERCSSECCFFYTTDLAAEILQTLQAEEVE